jgi:hypothetical protein
VYFPQPEQLSGSDLDDDIDEFHASRDKVCARFYQLLPCGSRAARWLYSDWLDDLVVHGCEKQHVSRWTTLLKNRGIRCELSLPACAFLTKMPTSLSLLAQTFGTKIMMGEDSDEEEEDESDDGLPEEDSVLKIDADDASSDDDDDDEDDDDQNNELNAVGSDEDEEAAEERITTAWGKVGVALSFATRAATALVHSRRPLALFLSVLYRRVDVGSLCTRVRSPRP